MTHYIFGGSESGTNYGRTNYIDYFDLKYPLNENNAIVTINNHTDSVVTLINEDTIKLKSNVASAYIGNSENLAEKVNAYYHDSKAWLGINTSNPFEWGNEDVTLALGDVIAWTLKFNNNLGWEMVYEVSSELEASITDEYIEVNAGTTKGTYQVTTLAKANNSTYEGTFNVEVVDAITWSTIPNQTIAVGSSVTINLSDYYTNVSYNDPTFSLSVAGGGYNVSWNSYLLTIQNAAGSGTIVVTVKATVNGIEYSTPFNLISA